MKKMTKLIVLTSTLLLLSCLTPGELLENAEDAWIRGDYVLAIETGLESYVRAVERNKDAQEIDNARSFLEQRFPQANAILSERAESQLKGVDSEKAEAWRLYSNLSDLNWLIRNSITSSFLTTVDYSEELREAKDVAAQIKYVKVLELMDEDKRISYIDASGIINEIDAIRPGFRDIRSLKQICIESATLIVAFSTQNIDINVIKGRNPGISYIADDVYDSLRSYIIANDYPDFLNFTSSPSLQAAKQAGAELFVEIQGQIRVSSEIRDNYSYSGRISWMRSYGGNPVLIVTRINDLFRVSATAALLLDQSLEIEFYPVRYRTQSMSVDLFKNQFNNSSWMNEQLSRAQKALSSQKGRAEMILWAEMQYGGTVLFLESADLNTTEEIDQNMTIDPSVYIDTRNFLSMLDRFLNFEDINLSNRMAGELSESYLSDRGVQNILSRL